MARPDANTVLQWYRDAKQIRSPREKQWRLNAAFCDPGQYQVWQRQDDPSAGITQQGGIDDNVARFVYDNTGIRSMPKYKAILHRMMTPEGQRYHTLRANDNALMKRYAVKVFFSNLTDILFQMRYEPRSNFQQAQGEMYGALGTYGTAPKVLTWRKPASDDPRGGFSYKSWHLVNIFLIVDDEGRTVGVTRRMYLNERQFRTKFPEEDALPPCLANANKSETIFCEFIHCVHRRGPDYDKYSLDARRYPWISSYLSVKDMLYIGQEAGFLFNPYMTPRAETVSENPYGRSPAEVAFPALGGLSAMKKTVMKQGQKAVSPPLLASDDGVLSGRVDIRPDKINWGMLDKQGNPLVRPLEGGSNFTVAEKLIEGDRYDVEDSFLVTLFRILEKNERMTTAEVYERVSLQAAQIAPTMGHLQSEDQGRQIEGEIALLVEYGLLPQMPPELIEAKGQYSVVYTSPLAKSMYAEEVAGFTRLLQSAMEYAAATGDKRPLRRLNFDRALPEIADKTNVKPDWLNSDEEVKALEAADAQQAQQDQLIKAAPALASVTTAAMKQQYAAAK